MPEEELELPKREEEVQSALGEATLNHVRFPPIADTAQITEVGDMRRVSKNGLKKSAVSSAKGILAGTGIFAMCVFSPIWKWAGHVPLTRAQGIGATVEIFVIITTVFVLTELLNWLWPKR